MSLFKKFFNKFIYFWLHWVFITVLGLCCCGEQGLLLVAVRGILIAVASRCGARASVVAAPGSVVVACGLWSTGLVVVAHGLSCSTACGIFPDQGLNLCPLHWQADS